jgi:5-methylcytosine-specific restriction endonuclease McrA
MRNLRLYKDPKNHPNWRGVITIPLKGKYGRDKDGLSWKVQRKLAWERDDYTCQECGRKEEGWKPDVHHKIPYRISGSHALDNLICYCRSCYKRIENEILKGA